MERDLGARPNVWPLKSYAPGRYACHCITCGDGFEGDKRAMSCLPCAILTTRAEFASLRSELDEARKALDNAWGQAAQIAEDSLFVSGFRSAEDSEKARSIAAAIRQKGESK